MKRKRMLTSFLLTVLCATLCLADRQLDRSEILQIFEQLTNEPRDTWITAGTIKGSHEEYRAAKITDETQIKAKISDNVRKYRTRLDKPEITEQMQKLRLDAVPFNTRYELSNEYTMSSTESVQYDGQRFKWEIDIQSRADSVRPGKDLEGNYMTDQFNTELNARRIFAWDGENYIMYTPVAEHALVDSAGEMPVAVNGPLTTGLIPWGHGYYSLENLSSLNSTAFEKIVDGRPEILLTLDNEDGSQISFVLDPDLRYAVISCSITGRGNTSVFKYYSDFENVSSRWVPMSIVLEKYEADSQKLLARDIWSMTVDANVPQDTLIEYISPINNRPLIYRYSSMADIDILLGEKLSLDAEEETCPQNCATVSMKYALEQLGIYTSDSQLAALVTEPDNSTTLYAMKNFAQSLGLNCRAVRTDIDTIKNMGDCRIILYLPGKKHFVALESVDSEYVRIVDLASRTFYYRTETSFFDMDWSTGVALVISNGTIKGNLQDLDDNELNSIVGASGYSCTKLLQEYNYILCQYVAGECFGYYTTFWPLYGCEAAPSGSCSTSWYIRLSKIACVEDIEDPWSCTVKGDVINYWARACSGVQEY
jgi:hypothetical protein